VGVERKEQDMKQQGIRQRRTMPTEVGQMLGRARMRAGLRGTEAARLLDISRQYLVRLESGQRAPSTDMADRLAVVLGLTEAERAELMAVAVVKPDGQQAA
jgi:transcriptional regulator with XRE-family HTH domain